MYLHKFQFEVKASKALSEFILFSEILQYLGIVCILPSNFRSDHKKARERSYELLIVI